MFVEQWQHDHKVNFVADSGFGNYDLLVDLEVEVLDNYYIIYIQHKIDYSHYRAFIVLSA